MLTYHKPVLLKKTLEGLISDPEGIYIDSTFGGGGHSTGLLKKISKKGSVLGFDQDQEAFENNTLKDVRLEIFHQNFRHIENILHLKGIQEVSGILADLGVSSHQLDTPERGFSIRFDRCLDMRMNQRAKQSAKEIVNTYSEEALARIFFEYGDLRNSRKLAAKILARRQEKEIETTFDLISIFERDIHPKEKQKFLAKVFQALRIEVNGELIALKQLLESALKILKKGGRIAVISYHSLEDRLVKQFLKNGRFDKDPEKDFYGNKHLPFKMLSRKPIIPDGQEILENPRAKSARLRIAEKI
ncbi:16S rRNA (cytosine(1402)-N(4))-methyltransferase RsmH [Bacteroidetes bacterium endosymbiont of Geopemphigus sp.]|uniref:16S rRNA (cytosine(1402)-N(4))-methyltransferase RsmH n=1 Tax=Bacteroidetes bacterium endosymbiont of Geopemphigus sp. TaxID=2047937 RepID=UPI000CCFF41A|nr:16S rRNA (cytosine(1402)-N(4))-methyltransferase RsmH [Bacteroidetes bacterium endosymbiont of Geopemphigus sp.]